MKSNMGHLIREFRKEQNFSIEKLAAQIGIHRDHLGRLERGEAQNPRADTLRKIADALNITLSKLLDDEAA